MLEEIPRVVQSKKLRIIQLLQADLNQVLRIAFTRDIARLAKNHDGVISKHQYDQPHRTFLSPVLNKLLTIQLLKQKKTHEIVFDNDAKGCYHRTVSGISLATLHRLGYSNESLGMLRLIWAKMQHHICT
jgi:hypothetical protein